MHAHAHSLARLLCLCRVSFLGRTSVLVCFSSSFSVPIDPTHAHTHKHAPQALFLLLDELAAQEGCEIQQIRTVLEVWKEKKREGKGWVTHNHKIAYDIDTHTHIHNYLHKTNTHI